MTYQLNCMIKYKDLEIEIEKMCHLRTTSVGVIVGALGMIKKGRDKHINMISTSSNQHDKKILHFAELLTSVVEFFNVIG